METFPDVKQFPPVQEFVPQFVPKEQLLPLDSAVQPLLQLFPAAPLGYPFPNSV